MNDQKQPYVRPLITRLEYTADVHVTAGGACKSDSGVGARASPCTLDGDCDFLGS